MNIDAGKVLHSCIQALKNDQKDIAERGTNQAQNLDHVLLTLRTSVPIRSILSVTTKSGDSFFNKPTLGIKNLQAARSISNFPTQKKNPYGTSPKPLAEKFRPPPKIRAITYHPIHTRLPHTKHADLSRERHFWARTMAFQKTRTPHFLGTERI